MADFGVNFEKKFSLLIVETFSVEQVTDKLIGLPTRELV